MQTIFLVSNLMADLIPRCVLILHIYKTYKTHLKVLHILEIYNYDVSSNKVDHRNFARN